MHQPRSLPPHLLVVLASLGPACSPEGNDAPMTRALFTSSDLFISEYVEGSSNNKAIELYNGTLAAVDLSRYDLQFFFNGSSTPGTTIPLSGTVEPGEVFVVADDDAAAAILAIADQTATSSFFNGDDAVALVRDGSTVDVLGQIGVDPVSEWTSSDGGTQNNTLRRVETVRDGDPEGGDAFDPATEWIGAGLDAFDGLGSHLADGSDPTGGEESGGEDPTPTVIGIHEVQGPGNASPLAGEVVTIEGVVVADLQDDLSGFFVQEEDRDADDDPSTSEGIFVFGTAFAVSEGDLVRVTGTATEYFDLTEIASVSEVTVLGPAAIPTPAAIAFPLASEDALEPFEGMAIVVPEPLTVTEHYDLGRFGEVLLAADGRLYQGTQVAPPGEAAAAVEAENALRSLLLDDLRSVQNPDPIPYPAPELTAENTLRGGTTVTGLVGVLDYGFGSYRVRPTEPPRFEPSSNPRPEPLPRAGSLRVASFNVLNYFNGDGLGGGFPTSRGASSLEEFERQSDKLVAAILALDADVVGLMEIENDGYGPQSAIAELVARLEAARPGHEYAFVDPGVTRIGTDEIAVGLLYRPAVVIPAGDAAILDGSIDPRFDEGRNRPALAQTFAEVATGERLTLAVNHLKSKGSDCDEVEDPDAGDGQGNCNVTRTLAAQALVDWLATDPTGIADPDRIILGDLNAYAMEDPIATIEHAGYVNVLTPSDYSYVFDGRWGTLDYQLLSDSLLAQLVQAAAWPINADEPRVLDYDTAFETPEQAERYYAPDPFRASDHDPIVTDFTLGDASPEGSAPTVRILYPIPGARLLPLFLVLAEAQDDEDAAGTLDLELRVDASPPQPMIYQPYADFYLGFGISPRRGRHTVVVRATDADGNESEPAAVSVRTR